MAVVGPPQAVVADAAVEIALVITANELKGFAVFEAVGVVGVHLVIK